MLTEIFNISHKLIMPQLHSAHIMFISLFKIITKGISFLKAPIRCNTLGSDHH